MRENVVDVDAAIVGISKSRWIALSHEEASLERAQQVMRQHQFDVLPIVAGDEIVREYFETETWNNYDSVQRKEVEYSDVIPFQTPLRTVIKSFAKEKRLFYFLTNDNRVTGLISVVNLNCRQVRIFIFDLVGELEIRLSEMIRSRMSEQEILDIGIKEEVRPFRENNYPNANWG